LGKVLNLFCFAPFQILFSPKRRFFYTVQQVLSKSLESLTKTQKNNMKIPRTRKSSNIRLLDFNGMMILLLLLKPNLKKLSDGY